MKCRDVDQRKLQPKGEQYGAQQRQIAEKPLLYQQGTFAAYGHHMPHLTKAEYRENVGLPFWIVVKYCPCLYTEANDSHEETYP